MPELPPVLFRDARFVVLDKPAGLPVHPGPRGGASVEDWFPMLSRRKDGPWLAHRLDADTSGCLVVALRRAALLEAQTAFSRGFARKTYWAVVHGAPAEAAGTIATKLLRVSTPAGWRMVPGPGGKPAETAWRLRGRDRDIGWLELFPRTGRTHQVRVHCALLGCPVLGDPIYGGGGDTGGGDTGEGGRGDAGGGGRDAGGGGRDAGGGNRGGGALHGDRPAGGNRGDGIRGLGEPGAGYRSCGDRGGADVRLHLMARAIELPLSPPVAATAEPPAHMRAALVRCGWDPDAARDLGRNR